MTAYCSKTDAGKLENPATKYSVPMWVEAMERLKDLTPDPADIAMPEVDGYQVCRQIRGCVATATRQSS